MRIRYGGCSCCGGDLHPLGALGNMEYHTCRHCGAQFSRLKRSARPRKRTAQQLAEDKLAEGWLKHTKGVA